VRRRLGEPEREVLLEGERGLGKIYAKRRREFRCRRQDGK